MKPGGPGSWNSEQWKNSDAVEALVCLAGGAASRGGVDRDFFFIAGRFANRAPSELPEASLARGGAAGQRGRLSDRRAATEATTLAFCVVFESRASCNSRFATTQQELLCL